jgi:Asp-tRNA(Asn)/Glu-tRNA(Gln) amidotransferase A subunit family amidase
MELSTKGPLATSIADARLLLDVLRGPIAGAPTALPSWTPLQGARVGRILATPRLVAHDRPLSPSLLELFDAALDTLEAATGLPVERIEPPYPPQLDDDWFTMASVDELTWLGREHVAEHRDDLTDYFRVAMELAARTSLDAYQDARRRRFAFCRQTDELLGDDGVLVCPTMCVEGVPAEGPGADGPLTEGSDYNTQPTNSTGHPSISVPAGVAPNGVPFGLQISGPRFRDDLVLALAEAWEEAAPWPLAAPGHEPFPVP